MSNKDRKKFKSKTYHEVAFMAYTFELLFEEQLTKQKLFQEVQFLKLYVGGVPSFCARIEVTDTSTYPSETLAIFSFSRNVFTSLEVRHLTTDGGLSSQHEVTTPLWILL